MKYFHPCPVFYLKATLVKKYNIILYKPDELAVKSFSISNYCIISIVLFD